MAENEISHTFGVSREINRLAWGQKKQVGKYTMSNYGLSISFS